MHSGWRSTRTKWKNRVGRFAGKPSAGKKKKALKQSTGRKGILAKIEEENDRYYAKRNLGNLKKRLKGIGKMDLPLAKEILRLQGIARNIKSMGVADMPTVFALLKTDMIDLPSEVKGRMSEGLRDPYQLLDIIDAWCSDTIGSLKRKKRQADV